ncbi:hypothetical protein [Sphaerospermopsis torques-reginae]|uniref:Uncharacterized protein n=1 Tax=Sphaerospermopsis torques-reginae ITEP-024 TaxID=984208 RepID=A0ABX8X1K4_9CYAN|nr:hypothetical protein [Sphaerospermopsis torques-reginae]QYX32326.1 hypothetical protein K2F26_02680 [Sphaerospermopsis torques-reginae ITEP-024]
MATFKFEFRTTTSFEAIASHLNRFCGISRELTRKRLHNLKTIHGLGGADNVTFDFSGGVYNTITGELLGSLTAGGAKEKA